MLAQETLVGKTGEAQRRNAILLSGYDYSRYATALTGFTGQDLQRIAFLHWEEAIRTRVGPRGNYKAGFTQLPDGRLMVAVCRDNNEADPTRRRFEIFMYESTDEGLGWREIAKTPVIGKEPSLTALPDGSIVMTAQKGYFGPGAKLDEIPISRSEDCGRTWQTVIIPGEDYPRNLIVEHDGSILMVRALKSDWLHKGDGSPDLQLCRSRNGGRSWEFSEGRVDWDYAGFGEVSAIRLGDGRLLAALRRQIPGTTGEGFEDTVITESTDDGDHWSKPWQMTNSAEVHVYLTELEDGRILGTYSNYHLPWVVYAILSEDGGRTWKRENPIQLALSAGYWVGWPVTLQLLDKSLITSYATTSYLEQPPDRFTCEVVRYHLDQSPTLS